MNKPLISIIIPVYNVEEYVEKCVKTVCAQTYENLEILIVDDGATDNSGKICDELAQTDERIRVFHTENHGLGAARNFGLDNARGEFVGFVDSDDWIDEDMYEFLYRQIAETGSDIAICSHFTEKPNQTKLSKFLTEKTEIFTRDEILVLLMEDKKINNYAWNKLYRRSLFEDLRFPDGLYEDIQFTFKLFYKSEKISAFLQPKYHYRQREGSIVSKKLSWKNHYSYFNAEFVQMSFLHEKGFPDAARHLCRRGIHTIKRLIRSNVSDEIIRDILQRLEPFDFIGFKELGFGFVFRRYMMRNHLQAYKKLYLFTLKFRRKKG